MKIKVGVVDYGVSGNLQSVILALEHVGADVTIIDSKDHLAAVEKVILPGVGGFKETMGRLRKGGLDAELVRNIREKPILGICLGMQIFSNIGFEFGKTDGLGLVGGEVTRMDVKGKVPHIGWAKVDVVRDNPLFEGIGDEDSFYFMHSYELVNSQDVSALTTYRNHRFVSAIQKGNIYGVQFHPEKSRAAGLRVLENFTRL